MQNFFFSLILFSTVSINYSQQISTFKIELPENSMGLSIPLSIQLDELKNYSPDELALFEIKNDEKTEINFQTDKNNPGRISWLVDSDKNQKEFLYEMVKEKSKNNNELIFIDSVNGALIIKTKNNNFLSYFFETVYPPEGVDTNYKRSGFIHPLWSPNGQVLTRIQPPDHYHHYGIWNPWTHVLFEGDTVDFWNIDDKKGTVRFVKFLSVVEGPVYAGFSAFHEHVVFKKDGTEKIALNEIHSVKVYKPQENSDYFFIDIDIELTCASGSPVRLLEYRYGGLGWRTTEKWDKNNSEVLTSEGKTRKDADGSKAKWCIVQGEIDDDYAGVVMMSFPENYNHPEPLRIWPENQNDRGDMFANFSPTKDRDWILEPGKKYNLKYRLMVFNNKMTKEKAELAWHFFAEPPMKK